MSEKQVNDAEGKLQRFPCEQLKYTKTVGRLLPKILGEIFTELGFEVKVNPQQANGVDLEVSLGNNLILVAEVLNWSIGSRLGDQRRKNIIRNLNQHDCNKALIYTVPLSNLTGLRESGIRLIELGHQILPDLYYYFFLAKDQEERRTIDSDSTRRDIRDKILECIDYQLFAHEYLKLLTASNNLSRNN